MSRRWLCCLSVMAMLWAGATLCAQEVQLSSDTFKMLDTFEAHSLQKADDVFSKKLYRQAAAEYGAFLLEFPKSQAAPYAVFRRARSEMLDKKRGEAIKSFQEVLDYFPDTVAFAAPSIYYIGLSHYENGDDKEAIVAWKKMADDAEYCKHPLAADALIKLAEKLVEAKRLSEAAQYNMQVAIEFRTRNVGAANTAIARVIPYFIKEKPDEAALRDFYEKVGSFQNSPEKLPKDLVADTTYWSRVIAYIRAHAKFEKNQGDLHKQCYQYWTGQMQGKFPAWDDFQLAWAEFCLEYEQDPAKWVARVDKQFADHQKNDDQARIIRWIRLLATADQKAKSEEYFKKLTFEKLNPQQTVDLTFALLVDLKNVELGRQAMARIPWDKLSADQTIGVMWGMYDRAQQKDLARATFARIPLDKMPDKEKVDKIFWHLAHRDREKALQVAEALTDRDYGTYVLLSYFHSGVGRDIKKGLEYAERCMSIPAYAQDASWKKAELLQWAGRYQDAIGAYNAYLVTLDPPRPDPSYRIADCYVALGKLDNAIGTLREVENFFEKESPRAAWRIAELYRDHLGGAKKENTKYVSALQAILAKYPKSGESSHAAAALNAAGAWGVKGGGVTASEDGRDAAAPKLK